LIYVTGSKRLRSRPTDRARSEPADDETAFPCRDLEESIAACCCTRIPSTADPRTTRRQASSAPSVFRRWGWIYHITKAQQSCPAFLRIVHIPSLSTIASIRISAASSLRSDLVSGVFKCQAPGAKVLPVCTTLTAAQALLSTLGLEVIKLSGTAGCTGRHGTVGKPEFPAAAAAT